MTDTQAARTGDRVVFLSESGNKVVARDDKMARSIGLDIKADRRAGAYRRLSSEVAWGSFAWFVSEPDKIVILRQGAEKKVKHLFELV